MPFLASKRQSESLHSQRREVDRKGVATLISTSQPDSGREELSGIGEAGVEGDGDEALARQTETRLNQEEFCRDIHNSEKNDRGKEYSGDTVALPCDAGGCLKFNRSQKVSVEGRVRNFS